eukprot:CAMPEP_0113323098 /NCGR_PEP_ID=MMETSP0010_2-20120614/16058_2 /TAXON_ID=216773 ORGANISM="Corethron hystrix, Strain 308" /NCGR_SAMPLE_ID=MMETSP0010_2 /ASSEMBLY_ACC=CAM_ASM_000155 /LENGTH=39 /DNA_ID=CAMNT_0000181843 /DNA_START=100 /DNA_END=219 /DNA_ORIENTATION=- /assembly_acc=CAM_ASM_000155
MEAGNGTEKGKDGGEGGRGVEGFGRVKVEDRGPEGGRVE